MAVALLAQAGQEYRESQYPVIVYRTGTTEGVPLTDVPHGFFESPDDEYFHAEQSSDNSDSWYNNAHVVRGNQDKHIRLENKSAILRRRPNFGGQPGKVLSKGTRTTVSVLVTSALVPNSKSKSCVYRWSQR